MSPEAAFLLATLRSCGASPPPVLDWDALLSLAESHGVLPLFCHAGVAALPEEFLSRSRSAGALSLLLARELEVLLEKFEERGISVIPLKGPVLAEMFYGHVRLRPSDDLDLLVHREEFVRAEALLAELGFVPVSAADNYHRDYQRNGVFVELHFQTASPFAPRFDLPLAWTRSRRSTFRGRPVRILSPVDQILYLALHGLKHRFARLIWVSDLARVLESLDPSDRSALLEEAGAQRLRNVLLASCEIARRCFAIDLPADITASLAANPRLVAQAAEMAEGILAVVADPTTSVHDAGSYLVLADPGHRWRRRLQFFLPTQQDYQWAARHGIPPRCAPLARPFRLLHKYGPGLALRALFPPSTNRSLRKDAGRRRKDNAG